MKLWVWFDFSVNRCSSGSWFQLLLLFMLLVAIKTCDHYPCLPLPCSCVISDIMILVEIFLFTLLFRFLLCKIALWDWENFEINLFLTTRVRTHFTSSHVRRTMTKAEAEIMNLSTLHASWPDSGPPAKWSPNVSVESCMFNIFGVWSDQR